LKIDKHIYSYETIVIGGGLNALLYSFFTGYPCIFVKPDPPFRLDVCDEKHDFGFLHLRSKNQREAWERLILLLGIAGQLPMTSRASSLNIRDNLLKVTTPNSRLGRFEFKKLMIFSDQNTFGLPFMKEQVESKYKVLDWFSVRSGMEHGCDVLEGDSDFVKRVHFYPSERFGNQKTDRIRKDLVSVSFLDQEKLDDFDYSDTMAKFKIINMMKGAGIRGARNGRDTYNPNIYRYYSIKIEATEREVIPNIKNYYEDDARFEFCDTTPVEIMEKYGSHSESYACKINHFF